METLPRGNGCKLTTTGGAAKAQVLDSCPLTPAVTSNHAGAFWTVDEARVGARAYPAPLSPPLSGDLVSISLRRNHWQRLRGSGFNRGIPLWNSLPEKLFQPLQ